jgi:hypothetical protein
MKVTILFEECAEDVGYDGQVLHVREDIQDLMQLADFLGDAVRGAGFSYVNGVAFERDDGEMVWGTY